MVKMKPRVVIDNLAKLQLRDAYEFIKLDSPQNAEKVKSEILTSIKKLAEHPERYHPDQYRSNNDGSYRAFELYRYRISFHVSEVQITIIRIRHTSMEPKRY